MENIADLLYLLLPIAGAFILLFVVCFCGRKVKDMFHIPKEVVLVSRMISSNSAQPDISNRRGDVEDHRRGRDHSMDSYHPSNTETEANSSEENNVLLPQSSTDIYLSYSMCNGDIVTVDVVNHSADNKMENSTQRVKEGDSIKDGSYLHVSGSKPTFNCDPSICTEESKDTHKVRQSIVLNEASPMGCHINHANVYQTKETCDKSTDTEGLSSGYLDLNLSNVVIEVCGKNVPT